jgi:hypothetical protein
MNEAEDTTEVITADTGRELELTTAEMAEVQAAKKPADTPAAAADAGGAPAAGAEDDDGAPVTGDDIRTLAAAATQAAQAASAATQELAASRAPAPAPAAAAPTEPDWNAERTALKAKYDAGEIDEDEYEAAREDLIERKADYKAAARADEVISKRLAQREAQDADRNWESALTAFNADATNATFTTDPVRAAAFRAVLDTVAKENPKASYADWLNTTRDRVATAFGVKVPTAASADDIRRAVNERKKGLPAPLPDLTRAPAAGAAATGDGLPTSELEDRLAAMQAKDPRLVDAFLADAPGGLRDNPRGE